MLFPHKNLLLLVLCAVVLAAPVYSQVTSCDLDLRIVNVDNLDNIDGAKAVLADSQTKMSQTAVARNGFLHFTNVQQDAEYELVITKIGYKRTVEKRSVICAPLFDGAVRVFGYLKKGNSKLTFDSEKDSPKGAFRIGSDDKEAVAGSVSPMGIGSAPPAPDANSNSDQIPKIVSKGVINGSATYLAKPEYSPAAKAVGASGAVVVQVTIDEDGNVISAVATSGHPLLRTASADAARASKFKPALLEGVPVKVAGIVVYNFQ